MLLRFMNRKIKRNIKPGSKVLRKRGVIGEVTLIKNIPILVIVNFIIGRNLAQRFLIQTLALKIVI